MYHSFHIPIYYSSTSVKIQVFFPHPWFPQPINCLRLAHGSYPNGHMDALHGHRTAPRWPRAKGAPMATQSRRDTRGWGMGKFGLLSDGGDDDDDVVVVPTLLAWFMIPTEIVPTVRDSIDWNVPQSSRGSDTWNQSPVTSTLHHFS